MEEDLIIKYKADIKASKFTNLKFISPGGYFFIKNKEKEVTKYFAKGETVSTEDALYPFIRIDDIS